MSKRGNAMTDRTRAVLAAVTASSGAVLALGGLLLSRPLSIVGWALAGFGVIAVIQLSSLASA